VRYCVPEIHVSPEFQFRGPSAEKGGQPSLAPLLCGSGREARIKERAVQGG
jgi:hypothetical protein